MVEVAVRVGVCVFVGVRLGRLSVGAHVGQTGQVGFVGVAVTVLANEALTGRRIKKSAKIPNLRARTPGVFRNIGVLDDFRSILPSPNFANN